MPIIGGPGAHYRGSRCAFPRGPTKGSSACVLQSPRGFTFKLARAAAAPAAPVLAGARFAASRSALRLSCRDGGIERNEQPSGWSNRLRAGADEMQSAPREFDELTVTCGFDPPSPTLRVKDRATGGPTRRASRARRGVRRGGHASLRTRGARARYVWETPLLWPDQ